jgi:hypothetical protein
VIGRDNDVPEFFGDRGAAWFAGRDNGVSFSREQFRRTFKLGALAASVNSFKRD